MTGYVWRGGRLAPEPEGVRIPGVGAFETIRIHRGAPFRLDAHLVRLEGALEQLDVPRAEDLETAKEGLRRLVADLGIQEGLVRLTVTPGDGGASTAVRYTPRNLPAIPHEVALVLVGSVHKAPGTQTRFKSLVRRAEETAAEEAAARGAFDGILLNPEGRLVDTSARNLFLVRGRRLQTPSLDEGALPGITRAAAFLVASTVGIPVEETRVPVEFLDSAQEVFLTGSGVGVLGVSQIEKRSYRPAPGPVTAKIRDGYEQILDGESRW